MFKQLLVVGFIFGSSLSLLGQSHRGTVTVKDTITDRDLVVPEEIERNFDQLLIDWKKDLKSSRKCSNPYDTNVAYDDAVYISRLYSLPTEMELVYNPIVRSYIDMYTGRMRNSVEYFLGKSSYYFPIFEHELDKHGLPLELKYLPIIESALNPTIVSRAGATGLWQFMIGTGKMYNLEINSLVDERRDPLKSTKAAVRYLKDLHNIYGDWNLVIAAYNCGPGNVNKAIKRSGGQTDYWAIYPYLPRETRGYVPAFIAATYVMNYYSEHNICPFEYNYVHSTDTVVVDKYLHLQQVADVLKVPIDQVRDLNPQFKKDIIPGEFKNYTVTLPSAQAADFAMQKDVVYNYRVNDFLVHRKVVEPQGTRETTTKRIKHKVRRGETLSSVASKHGVTSKQIKKWNRLKSNKLRAGQVLAINRTVPKPKKTTTQESNSQYYAENTTNNNLSNSVTTASTTTTTNQDEKPSVLSDYFSKYSNNEVSDNSTEVAEQVVVNIDGEDENESTVADVRLPDESRTIYHKVRIGETVALIASKYNVNKNDIAKWNKIKSSVPKIGQRLVIHLPAKPEKTNEQLIEENEKLTAAVNSSLLAQQEVNTEGDGFEQYRSSGPISRASLLGSDNQPSQTKSAVTKPVATTKKKETKKKKQTVYTVKKGDTLGHIVGKFGGKLTTKDIIKANRLSSDKLKVGQKLKIPR